MNKITLDEYKAISLEILKSIHKICEENNLVYFLDCGSLIGCIRHKGFIPWDDDIDVIMFRKDFEKLNEILEKNLDEKYNYFNIFNEDTYFYTWARLTLKNTIFAEWWADQVDYTPNIFIDIFILDNVPNNQIKRKIHLCEGFILNQLTMYAYIKFDNESVLKKLFQQTIYHLLKIMPISPVTIKKKCLKVYSKYKDEECDAVCDFPAKCQLPIYYKKDLLPLKKAKFEDLTVNVPNNPDKILTRIYGDYMELPPKDKRFRLAPEKIDFGKY